MLELEGKAGISSFDQCGTQSLGMPYSVSDTATELDSDSDLFLVSLPFLNSLQLLPLSQHCAKGNFTQ